MKTNRIIWTLLAAGACLCPAAGAAEGNRFLLVFETTKAIRRTERFQNLPIIALTAQAMRGDREKCLEAGAIDYIPKPVDTGRLLAAMQSHLANR